MKFKFFLLIIILASFGFTNKVNQYAQEGYSFFYSGDFKKALTSYAKAVKDEPANSDYHAWLGRTYKMLGDKDKAIKSLVKALDLNPSNQMASIALEQIDEDFRFNPEAEKLYQQGYQAFMKADYSKALSLYKKAIFMDLMISKYNLWLGQTYIQMGQLERAKVHIFLTLTIDMNNKDAKKLLDEKLKDVDYDYGYRNMLQGVLKYQENQFGEALSFFEQAIKLIPQEIDLHVWLTKTYIALGHNAKAQEHINMAFKLSGPNNEDVNSLRNKIY